MKIQIITDTHFNHDAMVEYCGRPVNHTEIVGNNLLKLGLTEQDILIHLGDVCIGKDEEMHEKYIKPLKCKKWLTLGNHDHKSKSWYLAHGWDFVAEQFLTTYFGKKILFSHYPIVWDGVYDFNIHGHFHNSDFRRQEPEFIPIKNGYQRLLAIEYTNLKSVSLEDFIKPIGVSNIKADDKKAITE